MLSIKELEEKKGTLAKAMHDIVDTEERTLSDEMAAKYDELMKEYRSVCNSLTAAQAQEAIDMAEAKPETRAVAGVVEDADEEVSEMEKRMADSIDREKRGSKPYGKWLAAITRGDDLYEYRSDETTIANNSAVVDKRLSTDIIRRINDLSGIVNLVDTVWAKGIYQQIISKVNSGTGAEYVVGASWVAENGAIGRSDVRYDTIDIKPFKGAQEVYLTLEMLNQVTGNIDLANDVVNQFGTAFAILTEQGILKGTGDSNGQPTGLISGGTQFLLPAAGTLTAANIMNIYHSLKTYYTGNAVWVMNNNTLCAIRQFVDGAGQYIFKQEDDFRSGYAGTILGKRVLVSDQMPDLAANASTTAYGAAPILYGDFASGYKAIRNPDINIQVLNEVHALNGSKSIVGIMWLGGKPVNNEAYVTVQVDKASG